MREEVIGSATLYWADCLDVLPHVQCDHVITDPPYEAEAHGAGRRLLGRAADRTNAHVREIEPAALDFEPMNEALRHHVASWAATSCRGWFLAFCQAEAVQSWRTALETGGARWRRAMVWIKPDAAPQLSGDRPAQGYESIAAAWCGTGRSAWNGGGRRGVFVHNKHDPGKGHGGSANSHPTQKPVRLMAELIGLFSLPGDVIADPFMGSGTTGVAALQGGRRFIGVESDQKYFELACERIENATRQERLFA